MQGGAAQGVGMALNEEYYYDESGDLKNASLLDYRMPTALDLPMIDPVIVEVPNPGHPYGVRGGRRSADYPARPGDSGGHRRRHRRADAEPADVAPRHPRRDDARRRVAPPGER